MASSQRNAHSEPAEIEQIITEFFAKSLHIILESRSPYVSSRNYNIDHFILSPSSSSSSSSIRPRDKWFNLALQDCPAALEDLDLWRQGNLEPLVIDVILVRRPSAPDVASPSKGGCLFQNLSPMGQFLNRWTSQKDGFVLEAKSEKIIERWIVQYESENSSNVARGSNSGSKKSSDTISRFYEMPAIYKKTYKNSMIVLRSLYAFVRLLPAYKLFQDLNSSGQIHRFNLIHRISSSIKPSTQVENMEMNQFAFMPVDTSCGRLCLSVSYLPELEDVGSEPCTLFPTQFIMDYVDSPMLNPLKRFQSLPSAGPPPTYVSSGRRHCWGSDNVAAAPAASPSPSPTYANSRVLCCNPIHRLPPRKHLTVDNPPSTCSISHNSSLAHERMNSDEYWPPPLSPSPSPSPNFMPGEHFSEALLRSKSAPALARLGRNSGSLNQSMLPSPPKGLKLGCSPQADNLRAQVSSSSESLTPPISKLQMEKEQLRLGEFQPSMSLQKAFSSSKDDVGNSAGLKLKLSSCSSPGISCPSSSKAYVTDSHPRIGSSDVEGHVRSLQTSKCDTLKQRTQPNKDLDVGAETLNAALSSGIAFGLSKPRTTADALEELKSYREMKDLLLRQGGSQS